jgi:hypothetical protein
VTPVFPPPFAELQRLAYDPEAFGFSGEIRAGLARAGFVADRSFALSELHRHLKPHDLRFVNQSDFTALTQHFFDAFERGDPIAARYRAFVENVAKPALGVRRLVYQRMPAIRFIFPRQRSLIPGKDELGSFHADVLNAHPPAEINFWVPCTRCWGSNSLQVVDAPTSRRLLQAFDRDWRRRHDEGFEQSLRDGAKHASIYGILGRRVRGRARALAGKEGAAFVFTPFQVHGTLYNRTRSTRVSVDFRVMRDEDYRSLKREYASLSGKRFYKVGDLYDVC